MRRIKTIVCFAMLLGLLLPPEQSFAEYESGLLRGLVPADYGGNGLEDFELLTDGDVTSGAGYHMNGKSEIVYELDGLYTITAIQVTGSYDTPNMVFYRDDILVGSVKARTDKTQLHPSKYLEGVNKIVMLNTSTSSIVVKEAEVWGFLMDHSYFYENGLMTGKLPDELNFQTSYDLAYLTDGKPKTEGHLPSNLRMTYLLDGEYTLTHYHFNSIIGNKVEFYNSEGELIGEAVYNANSISSQVSAQLLPEPMSGVVRVDVVVRDGSLNRFREVNVWGERTSVVEDSDGDGEGGVIGGYFIKRGIQSVNQGVMLGNYGRPQTVEFSSILPYGYTDSL